MVTDLGSRNGTYTGGHPLVDREVTVTPPSVVRTGRTVAVLVDDVRRFEDGTISSTHDAIVGPSTAPLWREIEAIAAAGANLLVLGEPGTGKGRLARGYARARNRPDIVFNPTIQAVPLERVVGPNIETLILEQVGKLNAANLATLVKLLDTRPALRVATTAIAPLEQLGLPRAGGAAVDPHDPPAAAARPARRDGVPRPRRGAGCRAGAADPLDAGRGVPAAAVAGQPRAS